MKIIGWLFLVSGWFIVLAALSMLAAPSVRSGFIMAGLGVEVLGLAILAYRYMADQRRSQ